jgi:hypothetical protein
MERGSQWKIAVAGGEVAGIVPYSSGVRNPCRLFEAL